ncbi:MAG: hypothetical protein JW850_20730 [Thermoflexales bacterium]|nr:hypothetical protein [Thermoflexales bacterium]
MKARLRHRVMTLAAAAGGILFFVVLVTALAACQVELDGSGLVVRDPVREAEATRVATAARDEAARRAIERQALQAQADQARAEAEATWNAVPAATLRNVLIFTGTGTGVLVLFVGSAFALVAWLNKRATAIYPNRTGQYPVIVRHGLGWVAFHDPNRGLGPGSIYRTPTVFEQAANAAAALASAIVAIRRGEMPALSPTGITAHYPLPGSESTMAQLATQAQAVSLMAAATRGDENPRVKQQVGLVARSLISPASQLRPALPPVTVLQAEDAEGFIRELLLSAPEEIAAGGIV